MKKILTALCIFACINSAIAEDKKYKDDCQHWTEISLGAIIIQNEGQFGLGETVEFIHQYLTNSGIDINRQAEILSRIVYIWDSHFEISQDLPEQLYMECDVK